MIPVQNTKNKIIIAISLIGLIILGLVVWYLNQSPKLDQIRELSTEEINANLMASSSPDFARRM